MSRSRCSSSGSKLCRLHPSPSEPHQARQDEEEFGTEISDEDAEKITRVKEAIEYIEGHAKKK